MLLKEHSGFRKLGSCTDNVFTVEKIKGKRENLIKNHINIHRLYKSF